MEPPTIGEEADGVILELDDMPITNAQAPDLGEMKESLITNTEALDRIQTSQQKMISGKECQHYTLISLAYLLIQK
jgi:hypothetical protein